MKRTLGVIIGRFQPFHDNHKELIDHSIENNDNTLIIIGSSYRSRSARNPFTYEERRNILNNVYKHVTNLDIVSEEDTLTNSIWVANIKDTVNEYRAYSSYPDAEVRLYSKDSDNDYYKKNFKVYTCVSYNSSKDISGASIRKDMYNGIDCFNIDQHLVPIETAKFIKQFDKNVLEGLGRRTKSNKFYQGVYVTADNVVMWKDYILLIRRKNNGLFAMPGGYLDVNEETRQCAIRELEEETGVKESQIGLRNNIVVQDINRSCFGRLITFVYTWECASNLPRPLAHGGDDAKSAGWYKISSLHSFRDKFHDDHYQIIKDIIRNV